MIKALFTPISLEDSQFHPLYTFLYIKAFTSKPTLSVTTPELHHLTPTPFGGVISLEVYLFVAAAISF